MMNRFIFIYVLSMCSGLYGILDAYRAVRAYNAGDLETAQRLLEPLFIHNQHDVQTAYNLGKIAYKKGAFAQAETYTTKAAEGAQDAQLQLQAYFDRGNAQVRQEKWHEALESYQKVIVRDPEHSQAQDMIEQIKKILEQQQQQDNNNKKQDNQDNQQQKNDQQQQNDQQNHSQDASQDNNDQQKEHNQNEQDTKQSDQQNTNNDQQSQRQEKNDKQQKDDDKSGQQSDNSQTDKKQGDQNRNKQRSKNDLGDDKGKNQGEQKGKKDEQKEQEQQSQGQIGNQSPDSSRDNHNQDKQDNAGQQHDKSSTSPVHQQGLTQDTVQEKKEQGGNSKPKDKEELLLSLLEEQDAQLIKQMLKAQVKQHMPRTYGQKNW